MKETKEVPTTAQFDVSINSGVATVKREFVFKGAKINLDIEIPVKGELDSVSIAELHRRSVRKAVALLQEFLPQEK